MALPKGFRNNIRLTSPNIGVPRRQELLDNIDDDGTFLPRGVHYKDIDETFIEFINRELNIEIDGNQVPVIFLTLQRYSEFTKTWQFTDEYKNIKIPFITIVRKPDVQVGTNYNGLYNIPGRPTFTYYKVPTNDGARVGVDVYKIPQPTSVDITYEVRLFTNKMSDLNLLNEKVQKKFQSRQAYIWPKGHPMPVMLESIGDESNIDDFENRRFYVQPFEMLLAGYILDEDDFEIIPTINRAMLMSEIELSDGVTTPIIDPKKGGGCIVATQGSVIVKNTDNTVLSVVSCGDNYVVGNSLIFNSGNTYSQLVPATTNFELPNETIEFVNTTGGTTSFTFPVYSNPIFSANTFCLPVNVINSGSTYNVWEASGGVLELPNITHIDSNLSPVTLPAQTPFIATPCDLASLSISYYSDSGLTTTITGATFGDEIYISVIPSNITPTEYNLNIVGNIYNNLYNQSGNTLSWVVNTLNPTIYVQATNGSSFAASVDSSLTVSSITEADNFITALETQTSDTMNGRAKDAVNRLVWMLKGNDTTNSTDLWTLLTATNAAWYIYCPNDDSTAYFDGYKIDLLDPTHTGTFINMVAGDISVEGVKGGSGKALNMDVQPADFDLDNIMCHFYQSKYRFEYVTAPMGVHITTPAANGVSAFWQFNATQSIVRVNNAGGGSYPAKQSITGVMSFGRDNATQVKTATNGYYDGTAGAASVSAITEDFYAHGYQNASTGASTSPSSNTYAGFAVTPWLSADEYLDFSQAWDEFNKIIITDGRKCNI
jgi:hypothetical protein